MPILTEMKIRRAPLRERVYKLYDERGLFLLVTPYGGRLWRFRYRIGALEKLISLERAFQSGAFDLPINALGSTSSAKSFRASWRFSRARFRGRAERDVSADLKEALAPLRSRNFASVTNPLRVGELLRAIDGYRASGDGSHAQARTARVRATGGAARRRVWRIQLQQG